MYALTLLERIAALAHADTTENARLPHAVRLEDAFLRHLTCILNTRKGSVPIAPDYGIADMTDLGRSFSEESIKSFRESLEATLLRYEPRLTSVKIRHITQDNAKAHATSYATLTPLFEISATAKTPYGEERLRFETSVDTTGIIRINEGTV